MRWRPYQFGEGRRVFEPTAFRQASEQYFTSAQFFSHDLRQVMGRPHTWQTFVGKNCLLPLKSFFMGKVIFFCVSAEVEGTASAYWVLWCVIGRAIVQYVQSPERELSVKERSTHPASRDLLANHHADHGEYCPLVATSEFEDNHN